MKVLENKAQIEALEAMSELQNARQRGTDASRGAEEVLSRLSHPMDISDNIRPRKASRQVHRGLANTNCVASVCVYVTLHFVCDYCGINFIRGGHCSWIYQHFA